MAAKHDKFAAREAAREAQQSGGPPPKKPRTQPAYAVGPADIYNPPLPPQPNQAPVYPRQPVVHQAPQGQPIYLAGPEHPAQPRQLPVPPPGVDPAAFHAGVEAAKNFQRGRNGRKRKIKKPKAVAKPNEEKSDE